MSDFTAALAPTATRWHFRCTRDLAGCLEPRGPSTLRQSRPCCGELCAARLPARWPQAGRSAPGPLTLLSGVGSVRSQGAVH